MRKFLTLMLSLALVSTATISAFAAAWADEKEDSSNPVISISYEKSGSNYNMTIESDNPGILYINGNPYKTNQTNIIKVPYIDFAKTETESRFVTGDKVYYLHSISSYTPSPASGLDGTEYIGSYGTTIELIYARTATQSDIGTIYSTFKSTNKHIEYETSTNTVDKYVIDSKDSTEAAYLKWRDEHSCKETVKTSYVNSTDPVFDRSETKPSTFTYQVQSNCTGLVTENIEVIEYYKRTQNYERVHTLETVDTTPTGDYSGTLKINAMNNLSSQVDVTGDIELGDTSINFTSERFSIKNGKGTFKTNSLSAISLSKLLVGQTYKISNVKAGDKQVSVSPASGKIANGTVVNITLTDAATSDTTYKITWKDWDGKVLKSETVKSGVVPSYGGTPTKVADETYTYKFQRWTPNVVAASKDTTYTAVYEATKIPSNTYVITWKNWDGMILKTSQVSKGVVPSYGGTPTRADDDNYTYVFSGWSPSVVAATRSTTYTAQFKATAKPAKEYNGRLEINAVNSLKSPVEVTGNIELSDTSINFTSERFNIKNGKGTFKTTSQGTISLSKLLNGQTFKISNVKAGNTSVVVSPSSGKVSTNTSVKITLKESATTNAYIITWKNWDGKVLATSTVSSGVTPSYRGTPTRAADANYTYTFSGWTPTVTKATANKTYTATYKATAKVNKSLPKVTIKAPGKAKASFTAKWTKLSKANQKKVTGLQVQCSTSSKFNTNVKTVNAGKATASKKVTKLKRKTTYYVRVRAYKKSGSLTSYGAWSGVKSVKTK